MKKRSSPTIRLLAGLAVTLSAVAVYSAYSFVQLHRLEELQTTTIDRNRMDSLLLLRIQRDMNDLALTMRDMLEGNEPYPLTAWQGPIKRIRTDLTDALEQEAKYSPLDRGADQRKQLSSNVTQFWDALDRMFEMAASGEAAKARDLVRVSLQARQETLSAAVARLLVSNNEAEQEASDRVRGIYVRVERNVYWFLAAMLVLIVFTSLYLMQSNRRLFQQVAALSERRSELAQQVISMQENTFRSISRELHDEFGQILTAVGAMLQRAGRKSPDSAAGLEELREVQEAVQEALEKVRTLSRALHPVTLEETGFESALEDFLPGFERQTGVRVTYSKEGTRREVDRGLGIHLYRVAQEALNNVARHSKSATAEVRLRYLPDALVLEVEDHGVGFGNREKQGMGVVSMRERAEMIGAGIEFVDRDGGGALVRLTAPLGPA